MDTSDRFEILNYLKCNSCFYSHKYVYFYSVENFVDIVDVPAYVSSGDYIHFNKDFIIEALENYSYGTLLRHIIRPSPFTNIIIYFVGCRLIEFLGILYLTFYFSTKETLIIEGYHSFVVSSLDFTRLEALLG